MNERNDPSASPDWAEIELDAARLQALFTIGDMAQLYGLTLRALRFYEDRGLLVPLRHGTKRFYNAASRARLETILRGKAMGFTLTQIRTMLARETATPQSLLGIEASEVEAQIGRLERKREGIDRAIEDLRMTHRRMKSPQAGTTADANAVA